MKLSRDIDKFYAEHYEKIMGNGAIGIVWKRIHKQIDKKFCTSLAPFNNLTSIRYWVRDQDKNLLAQGYISNNLKCDSLTILPSTKVISIETDAVGIAPSLFDRRKLLYRIWNGKLGSSIF